MESTKNWLEKAIEEGHINFHAYDKFSDVEAVGKGAFGEVYKASWNNRGMVVALKSLLGTFTEGVDSNIFNEFINEVFV